MRPQRCETCRSNRSVRQADSHLYAKTHPRCCCLSSTCRYESRCPFLILRGSEIPLVLIIARVCHRAPLTIGVLAVAAGALSVACGSNGTTAPTSTPTTTSTSTPTTSAAASGGGGHHERHESPGGAAPAATVTVDPSTVTNTETDVQTTVQTTIATATETVTATPTYQPRDQYPRNDNRSQSGAQQGH
jgi:hypothetical protein